MVILQQKYLENNKTVKIFLKILGYDNLNQNDSTS